MTKLFAYEIYLRKGQADLRTSIILLNGTNIDFDIVCFHFQQFIEKYLKAFLIFNNITPKRIHDITILLEDCINIDAELKVFENSVLIDLSDCSVLIRYDEMEEIDKEFLLNALPAIEKFKAYIESKINF